MTRRRGHEAVLRSLKAALASNLRTIKLNVVVVQGLNDHEIFDFLELTRERELSVRFIEFMPFTGDALEKAPSDEEDESAFDEDLDLGADLVGSFYEPDQPLHPEVVVEATANDDLAGLSSIPASHRLLEESLLESSLERYQVGVDG